MRLLTKKITKDGGSVAAVTRNSEDLWHLYNLISIGDCVTAKTLRKLQKESASGVTDTQRKLITLCIAVQKIDFDPIDGLLRLSGPITVENPWAKLGSYHTLELAALKKFILYKVNWDPIALMRLDEATNESQHYQVAAVIMQEGLANICLLSEYMTLTKAHITHAIPRKRKAAQASREKGIQRFFHIVYDSLLKDIDLDNVKAIVIASPGFVKDHFFEFAMAQAIKDGQQNMLHNKHKFLLVHSSAGHRHALNEILSDKSVQNAISDTKAAAEIMALQEFWTVIKKDPERAVYGNKHVQAASNCNAISCLLLCDHLFRAKHVEIRNRYISIVENVKSTGGHVHIFSSMHVSGEQLAQLSGIAAILYFPLNNLDDQIEEMEEESISNHNNTEIVKFDVSHKAFAQHGVNIQLLEGDDDI